MEGGTNLQDLNPDYYFWEPNEHSGDDEEVEDDEGTHTGLIVISFIVLLIPLCFTIVKRLQHRQEKNTVAPAPYFYQKQPPTPMIRTSGKLQVSEVMKAERENHFELVPQHTEQQSTPSDDKQIQQNTRADIE